MSLVQAISIDFKDNQKARAKSLSWCQRQQLGPAYWWVGIGWGILVGALLAIGAGSAVLWGAYFLGAYINPKAGFLIGIVGIWLLQQAWCRLAGRKMYESAQFGKTSEPTYRFDQEGFLLKDPDRTHQTNWRRVQAVESNDIGLFMAVSGLVYYLPADCWEDSKAYLEESKQIIAWWQGSMKGGLG